MFEPSISIWKLSTNYPEHYALCFSFKVAISCGKENIDCVDGGHTCHHPGRTRCRPLRPPWLGGGGGLGAEARSLMSRASRRLPRHLRRPPWVLPGWLGPGCQRHSTQCPSRLRKQIIFLISPFHWREWLCFGALLHTPLHTLILLCYHLLLVSKPKH